MGGLLMKARLESIGAGAIGAVVISILLSPLIGRATYVEVPTSGIILWKESSSCPSGYSEATDMQGFYPVGMPSGGTINTSIGTALTNTENRAVGQHNHGITDPGHKHGGGNNTNATAGFSAPNVSPQWQAGNNSDTDNQANNVTVPATTGITINNAGSVAGTNAPHRYVLFCKKN